MSVWVSLSCLKGKEDIFEVLDIYRENGINRVELGSWIFHVEENDARLVAKLKKYSMNFQVHNYFPPHKKEFVINLASADKDILKASREYVIERVRFCSDIGSDLFSVHAGFCADPDAHFNFNNNNGRTPYNDAFSIFADSIGRLNDFASKAGVRIAIENNVVLRKNLVNGRNELLLMCDAADFERLWKAVSSENLGMLLDLGHLKVSVNTFGRSLKDAEDFIDRFKEKTLCIHIHDNDGISDTHGRLEAGSWVLGVLERGYFNNISVVLETRGLDANELKKQIGLIRSDKKK